MKRTFISIGVYDTETNKITRSEKVIEYNEEHSCNPPLWDTNLLMQIALEAFREVKEELDKAE